MKQYLHQPQPKKVLQVARVGGKEGGSREVTWAMPKRKHFFSGERPSVSLKENLKGMKMEGSTCCSSQLELSPFDFQKKEKLIVFES